MTVQATFQIFVWLWLVVGHEAKRHRSAALHDAAANSIVRLIARNAGARRGNSYCVSRAGGSGSTYAYDFLHCPRA
jgi:hypothetical protein